MITISSVDAQNRFGQLLDTVQREPVVITRHGRMAAYMVSAQDMQDLQNLQTARTQRQSAVQAFEDWSQRAAAAALPAAAELTDSDVVRLVKESR